MLLQQPTIITTHKARDTCDRHGEKIQFVIFHATAGTSSLGWLKGNTSGTSIHVLIEKDGTCYQMVSDERGANHVGFSKITVGTKVYSQFAPLSPNTCTLGIELENLNNGKDPYPEVQLRAAAWWYKHWVSVHGPLTPLMHRQIDQHGKTDAYGIELPDILRFLDETNDSPGLMTGESVLVSAARSPVENAVRYLVARKTDSSYTAADIAVIADFYWTIGKQVGIDPLISFSQMIHETGGLTSWWSLRPRRNPAGIGVTGETSKSVRAPGVDWQMDLKSRMWKRGYCFADWQVAARAHYGHLIAYSISKESMTDAQKQTVIFDPRATAIPVAFQGTVKVLKDLNGKWAVPGDGYGEKIASIANDIIKS